ncbi:MAG: ATP-binding protein [Tahibacter sp.]
MALRPIAERKGLELEVRMPAEEIIIRTDHRALSQIVINLTNNAIKYTETGKVIVELSRRQDREGRFVEISVRDIGSGIRAEDQAKLFHAFSQLDSSSTRQFEGTGLGLHLSQKLAELLGAHISFHSEFGKGSTFTLSIVDVAVD